MSELAAGLNRAGLVLNFLAFFVAGPEIVVPARMDRLFSEATGMFISYVMGLLAALIPFVVGGIMIPTLYWGASPIVQTLSPAIPLLTWLFVTILAFTVAYFATLGRATGFLVRFFAGDIRRRRIILWTGILMFVLGNAFQFVATYPI